MLFRNTISKGIGTPAMGFGSKGDRFDYTINTTKKGSEIIAKDRSGVSLYG